jgi:hypothetical protein
MKPSSASLPIASLSIALLAALILAAGFTAAPSSPDGESRADYGNYDIRIHGRSTLVSLEQAYGSGAMAAMREEGRKAQAALAPAQESARRSSPGLQFRPSELLGGAEVVRSDKGFLPGSTGSSSTSTTLAFLRRNAGAYGLSPTQVSELEVIGESPGRAGGIKMVKLRQRVNGLPVFQSETRGLLNRKGRLVRTVGRLVPGLESPRVPSPGGLIAPEAALSRALASVGVEVDAALLHSRALAEEPGALEILSDDGLFLRPAHSERVYFPLAPGIAVPAWYQTTLLRGFEAYATVVDGRTGVLLYRKNLRHTAAVSKQDARFSVYADANGHPLEGPAPGSPNHILPGSGTQFPAAERAIISMHAVRDPVASPKGWINDRGKVTTGNNVDAFLSRNGDLTPDLGLLDDEGRPMGNPDAAGRERDFLGLLPRNYSFTPAPQGSDPDAGDDPAATAYQRGVVTDLFYLANWYHDRVHQLGFDEAAGNLQFDNFHRGGKRRDPVQALAQVDFDLGGTDTAYSLWFPDGEVSLIAMGIFAGPSPDRDAGLDAPTAFHELTHGLTLRILGNTEGLSWGPGQGLGEGWRDFYGMALTYDRAGDDPDAQFSFGGYPTYLMSRGILPPGTFTDNYLYGFRRFPYTTDNGVNPLTFADVDQATIDLSGGIPPSPFHWETFGAAEGHSMGEIWALALWEARSRIIAANGGDVCAGNQILLQIVTDGVKMTPIEPGFLDARDAVLDADCAANACANEASLWAAFADRGMGYTARESGAYSYAVGVQESLDVPFLDVDGVEVEDALGNGNGFAEPGETVSLRVRLANPWRQTSKGVPDAQATLSTAAPGVVISDASSSYGPIPARGTSLGDSFTVQIPAGAGCGSSLEFTLQTSSDLGPGTATFGLRLGVRGGPGAPITFSRAISGGLAIPDGGPGISDPLAIAQDFEIADLDFVVDELRHPFVGNLTFTLRSPDACATMPIYRLGMCSGDFCSHAINSGDDFIGTRIDDASANDLMTAGPALAPFTGTWFPTLNSSLFPSPDPVRQLGAYNGRSSAGTWQLLVSDGRRGNGTGTLYGWSLVLTPVTYTCGP